MQSFQEIRNKHFPTFTNHYFIYKKRWVGLSPATRTILKLLSVFVVLAAIPITVNLSQQQQNVTQEAAQKCRGNNKFCITPTITSYITPTPIPSQAVSPIPSQSPTPAPTSFPTPTTSGLKTITVISIASLLSTLRDNTVDVIVVKNGTYHVSTAASQASDSLWITNMGRTRPVVVRAETKGGVTFDGGGARYFGCISFEDGAHDQTWEGFRCANGEATATGVVTFGGYSGYPNPAHNITMRNITILSSNTGSAVTSSSPATDHAFYISQALGGPHDLLFEDITVDGRGGLASAFHFYHSDKANNILNGQNVTVRRLHVTGTQQAIILWDPTLKNILFEDVDVTNALSVGVRYETTGSQGIMLRRVITTGSGQRGFYSSQGTNPVGVSFESCSFN